MDEYEARELVSDWGIFIDNAIQSGARSCPNNSSQGCKDTLRSAQYGAMFDSFRAMAKIVVGFTKSAPYSSATKSTLAVISQCEGCHGYYWYHLKPSLIWIFVRECPAWPADQKAKFE